VEFGVEEQMSSSAALDVGSKSLVWSDSFVRDAVLATMFTNGFTASVVKVPPKPILRQGARQRS